MWCLQQKVRFKHRFLTLSVFSHTKPLTCTPRHATYIISTTETQTHELLMFGTKLLTVISHIFVMKPSIASWLWSFTYYVWQRMLCRAALRFRLLRFEKQAVGWDAAWWWAQCVMTHTHASADVCWWLVACLFRGCFFSLIFFSVRGRIRATYQSQIACSRFRFRKSLDLQILFFQLIKEAGVQMHWAKNMQMSK